MRKQAIYLVGILICGMALSSSLFSRNTIGKFQASQDKEQMTEQLKIFPNPTDGKFQLTLNFGGMDKVVAKVYDMTGKLIKDISRDLVIGEESVTADIHLDSPRAGIYFLRIEVGNQRLTKKIIVK